MLGFRLIFVDYSPPKRNKMRQRFEQQMSLATEAISDVKFSLKTRDELAPVLRSLQYIFVTPDLNEQVFALLEGSICEGKKRTGRKGMDLWHILVLAVVRHTLNTNWDSLQHRANYDLLVRGVLGVNNTRFSEDKMEFSYQSIIDNVSLVKEDLLHQINELVVAEGHKLLKKKEEALRLKSDSYVLETNVHFPTDLNLLWDSARKCLDMLGVLCQKTDLKGWRKLKYIRKNLKSAYRSASYQVFKGKKEEAKIASVKKYLGQVKTLVKRCKAVQQQYSGNTLAVAVLIALEQYCDYAVKFLDLTRRRLLENEIIPACEKIYSIFEPHTEWITKGKLHKKVELGHLLLITTDQFQFIVDYHVMENQKDPEQIPPLITRLQQTLKGETIYSHSFDKGFYSNANYETLQESGLQVAVLPKKGKRNAAQTQRESTKEFKQLRNAHSAVESNINMLEHHGLNRCPDKGLPNYKKYVGLSVLAYNLHILGNHLMQRDKEKEDKRLKRKAAQMKQAA